MEETMIQKVNVGADGKAQKSYTVPSGTELGVHKIKARYIQNDNYQAAESEAKNYDIRNATTISVNNAIGNKNEQISLSATVLVNGSTNVTSGQVQFKVAGVVVGNANVNNGVATLDYTITADDESVITANYLGVAGVYGASTNTAKLDVRRDTDILLQNIIANRGETITIAPTFTYTENGETSNVTSGTVTISLDGTTLTSNAQVSNGTTSYEYEVPNNLSVGAHVIRIEYQQNDDYESESYEVNLNIRSPVTVTVDDVSGNPGETITLTGHAKDYANDPVTEGYINFKVGEETIKSGAASTGTFTASYTVPANATGTISFSGAFVQSTNYEGGETSTDGTITVRKAVTVTASDVNANVGETAYLIAEVKDGNNDAVTTGEIEFVVYDDL